MFSVVDSIADNCSDGTVVVVKSTVPIGTCESVRRRIDERRPDLHFFVVSNPEFLSQGTAVRDTFNADRIIIARMMSRHIKQLKKCMRLSNCR